MIAGVARIESRHGRYGGRTLRADGRVDRPIIGIALDGGPGVRAMVDTDDGDSTTATIVWDRAVGPLQFIPETWLRRGRDGNGDGRTDPQNIYDAAYSAGRYLCALGGDLSSRASLRAAYFGYNNSTEYVNDVIGHADRYADLRPSRRRPAAAVWSKLWRTRTDLGIAGGFPRIAWGFRHEPLDPRSGRPQDASCRRRSEAFRDAETDRRGESPEGTDRVPRGWRESDDTARSGRDPRGNRWVDRRHGGARPERPGGFLTGIARERGTRTASRRGRHRQAHTAGCEAGRGNTPDGRYVSGSHRDAVAPTGAEVGRGGPVPPGTEGRFRRTEPRRSGPGVRASPARARSHRQDVPTGRPAG